MIATTLAVHDSPNLQTGTVASMTSARQTLLRASKETDSVVSWQDVFLPGVDVPGLDMAFLRAHVQAHQEHLA